MDIMEQALHNIILPGDALEWLPLLPSAYVQAVITSPPYWNLRSYGVPPTSWPAVSYAPMAGLPPVCVEATNCCLGLEPTLEAFVGHLVAIFREVRRVLRPDGVCWMNLGDAYAADGRKGRAEMGTGINAGYSAWADKAAGSHLKRKDLCLLPHRVALALQADGWWVRNDVVWSKPNSMPDSTTDRCSRSHEYVFHLTKSARYFFDAEAIREAIRPKTLTTYGTVHRALGNDTLGRVKADNWARSMPTRKPATPRRTDKQRGHSRRHAGFNDRWDAMTKAQQCASGRNKRSVWTISSGTGFPEAHFATMPPELVEVCVASASRPGDLVLDPFMGAGTVAVVCRQMGRDYLGIELNANYVTMAERRIARVAQPSLLYAPRRSATVEALEEGVV
jgi:DNA modification methylase